MELAHLRSLPAADQQTFLLGRIAGETTSMDAALRFVNAALRGRRDIDAFLESPDYFSSNVKACRKLADEHEDLSPELRKALAKALKNSSTL